MQTVTTTRWGALLYVLRRRWIEVALILASLAFVANDWSGKPDLWVDALGRLAMALLALFLLFARDADTIMPWLVAALIGFSFDIYWQTEDLYGAGPLQSSVMVVKYAGVGAGLAALLYVCARYLEPRRPSVRRTLGMLAPYAGALVMLVGCVHGAYWIAQTDGCGNQQICENLAMLTYRAYLGLDVLVRLAIAAAVGLGVATLRGNDRKRLQFIALAATLFTLGTLLHFGALAFPEGAKLGSWPDRLDQFTSFLFPVFIAIAIRRRDINYVLNKTVTSTAVVVLLTAIWGALEFFVHSQLEPMLTRNLNEETDRALLNVITFSLAAILALAFKPIEERMGEKLEKVVNPDRAERLEVLKEFGDKIAMCSSVDQLRTPLRRAIARGLGVDFAVFVRSDEGFERTIASERAPEQPAAVKLTATRRASLGRGVRLHLEGHDAAFGGACLVLPMPVAGQLYGVLACWPREDECSYEPDEVRELALIAREVGATIYASRA